MFRPAMAALSRGDPGNPSYGNRITRSAHRPHT